MLSSTRAYVSVRVRAWSRTARVQHLTDASGDGRGTRRVRAGTACTFYRNWTSPQNNPSRSMNNDAQVVGFVAPLPCHGKCVRRNMASQAKFVCRTRRGSGSGVEVP